MPRRKKNKLTDEEKQAQIDAWKKIEDPPEYPILEQLTEYIGDHNLIDLPRKFAPDIPFDIQPFLDLIHKACKIYKVKKMKKVKFFEQKALKFAMFGGANGRGEPFEVDGRTIHFLKPDTFTCALRFRQNFLAFINKFENLEWLAAEISGNNLKATRKAVKKIFTEFSKEYKSFAKKKGPMGEVKDIMEGKDHPEEPIEGVLQPLTDLLESNNGLTLLDFNHQDKFTFQATSFKYKALVIQFVKRFQRCQDILVKYNKFEKELKDKIENLKSEEYLTYSDNQKAHEASEIERIKKLIMHRSPDICSVLKKFQLEGWREKVEEWYYVQPLLDSFLLLRANLAKLYYLGFNFWREPVSGNETFLVDCIRMEKQELVAERLLGNRLKREQFNFLFQTLKCLFHCSGKQKFLSRSEKILQFSVPHLAVLKSMVQAHKIFWRKFTESTEGEKLKIEGPEPPAPLVQFALISSDSPENPCTWQDILPAGATYEEKLDLADGSEHLIVMDDNSIPELDKYGRFFIWPDFLPEELRPRFMEGVKLLRDINHAVVQDLEDYIIAQGIICSRDERQKTQDNSELLQKLLRWGDIYSKQKKKEIEKQVFKNRPPNMWNEPGSLSENHSLHCSAEPFKVYKDDRVYRLFDMIKEIVKALVSYKKEDWDFLVERVIDVYDHLESKEKER